MFSFYAGSKMNTAEVDLGRKTRRCHCFSLVPYCRHMLPYPVSHSNFFAIHSVTQFSAILTSRPCIHGSTITTVLVPAFVIDPWYRLSIAVDFNGPYRLHRGLSMQQVVYDLSWRLCLAVTTSFLQRMLSVPSVE
jgi:hypothetical protein